MNGHGCAEALIQLGFEDRSAATAWSSALNVFAKAGTLNRLETTDLKRIAESKPKGAEKLLRLIGREQAKDLLLKLDDASKDILVEALLDQTISRELRHKSLRALAENAPLLLSSAQVQKLCSGSIVDFDDFPSIAFHDERSLDWVTADALKRFFSSTQALLVKLGVLEHLANRRSEVANPLADFCLRLKTPNPGDTTAHRLKDIAVSQGLISAS